MKHRNIFTRLSKAEKLAVTLALLAVMFLASVLLAPPSAPLHVLAAPANPASAAPALNGTVAGTIAAIGALAPILFTVYLPFVDR